MPGTLGTAAPNTQHIRVRFMRRYTCPPICHLFQEGPLSALTLSHSALGIFSSLKLGPKAVLPFSWHFHLLFFSTVNKSRHRCFRPSAL